MMIICHFVHPVERRWLPVKNSVNTVEHLLNNFLRHPQPPLLCPPLLVYPRQSR